LMVMGQERDKKFNKIKNRLGKRPVILCDSIILLSHFQGLPYTL
jgi:hypothetical protein